MGVGVPGIEETARAGGPGVPCGDPADGSAPEMIILGVEPVSYRFLGNAAGFGGSGIRSPAFIFRSASSAISLYSVFPFSTCRV